MPKISVGKDAQSLAVETTFRALFRPIDPKEFGSSAKQSSGLSDVQPGRVQWSAWYDHKHTVALLAVNLEGMKDEKNDWPIGRLIRREREDPRFPDLFAAQPNEADVVVTWDRDAWVMYRVPIREKEILKSPVQKVDRVRWQSALIEASGCLRDGTRGRAIQSVTLPHKGLQELAVSPHLQFRTPLWALMPAGHQARLEIMQSKRDLLAPFHELAAELAK